MNDSNQNTKDLFVESGHLIELSKALFEKSSHALLVLDSTYHILDFNHEFRSLFFIYQLELKGKTAQEVLKAPVNQLIENKMKGQKNDDPFSYDVVVIDGLSLPRSVTCIVTPMDQPRRFLIEYIDETELLRNQRALKATRACIDALQASVSEADLMEKIVKIMIDMGQYRFSWIGLLQNDEKKTLLPVAFAGHEDGYLANIDINLTDPNRFNGPIGQAMITNQPKICRNTESDPKFAPWRDGALKRGYHSVIGIPLSSHGNAPIGAFNLYSADFNAFDLQEVELLVQMASSLTFGIQLRRIDHMLQQTSNDLNLSMQNLKRIISQTVGAISTTIDFRDPFTDKHQKRVADLAAALVTEMNLGQEMIYEITVAANLHDIGKVTISNEILNKLEPVTPEEFEIVKTHSQFGYDLIKDIEFPWPIAKIVLQHHEKINGSGYPRGLKGEEILLSARILCVADVVEAMVSERPYRKGLGMEAALDEIKKNRGILYDEKVVDACLRLIQEHRFHFEEDT